LIRGQSNIKAFRLDLNAYERKMKVELTLALQAAVRAYLTSILKNVIPVWSGASVATFLKLSAEVNLNVTISPVVKSRIGLGRNLSEGEIDIDASRGRYIAKYSTSLPHLIFNEYQDANAIGYKLKRPGPYNFQGIGAAAFNKSASSVRLPNPFLHLK
jgi:hypothetical protein